MNSRFCACAVKIQPKVTRHFGKSHEINAAEKYNGIEFQTGSRHLSGVAASQRYRVIQSYAPGGAWSTMNDPWATSRWEASFHVVINY